MLAALISVLSEIKQPASVVAAKTLGAILAFVLTPILVIRLLKWLDDDHRR